MVLPYKKKLGFKKYTAAQKAAYYAKKAQGRGTAMMTKRGLFKSRNYPKSKFSMVKTIENIVRSMGPPRNIAAIGDLITIGGNQQAGGQSTLAASLSLIAMNAQSGQFNATGLYAGAFPTSNQGSVGLTSATTNEYFLKKMKTRLIITPIITASSGAQPPVYSNIFNPIFGFRIIHFCQRRDLEGQGTLSGLYSGFGSAANVAATL